MSYSLQLQCPGQPRVQVLAAAIEAVVWANCEWYLEQWKLGQEPPCCCDCAGIRYRPDRPGSRCTILGAPQAIKAKVASCHTATALVAGRGRALAIAEGYTPEQAAQMHYVELIDGYHPEAGDDPYWHAIYRFPGGFKDETQDMEAA